MKKLKKIDIYTIPLVFVCIATVTLRSFALLTSFNWETMHFDDKTAITIRSIILAISVIGFLTYLFLGDKDLPFLSFLEAQWISLISASCFYAYFSFFLTPLKKPCVNSVPLVQDIMFYLLCILTMHNIPSTLWILKKRL